MNTIVIFGRVTRDPEVFWNEEGDAMLSFTLADNSYGKKKTVNFFRCVCFGARAEKMGNLIGKGTGLMISGKLETGKYVGKDGIERQQFDVLVNDFTLTDSKLPKIADKIDTPDTPQKAVEP